MNDNRMPEEKLLELIKKGDPFQKVTENVQSSSFEPKISAEVVSGHKKNIVKTKVIFFLGLFFFLGILYLKNSNKLKVMIYKPQPEETQLIEEKIIQSETIRTKSLEMIKKIASPSHLSLLGIINGINPSAIIEDLKSGRNQTIEIGDEVVGFNVQNIEKGQVTFTNGSEKFTLKI